MTMNAAATARWLQELNIAADSPVPATLRLLISTGLDALGAQEGSFLVHDADSGDLRFVMTVGNDESEAILVGQRVPLGAGITGLAAECRAVQIGTPGYAAVTQPQHLAESGPQGVLAAPVIADDRLVGVITAVTFETGRRFDVAAARIFGALAVVAGVLIAQAQTLARYRPE
jgi:GAF domain-containing protein